MKQRARLSQDVLTNLQLFAFHSVNNALLRLSNLVKIREQLSKLKKANIDSYNANTAEFLQAIRLARQAKDDLNDITRRLS